MRCMTSSSKYPPLRGAVLTSHPKTVLTSSADVSRQVGTVMALNFCLALRPPLLKVTPELLMILQEALGIAETDEQASCDHKTHFPLHF